jgi:hypothetical protein
MSWKPLSDRIDPLPLILAGPILRRTEPDAVTVWVALKQPRFVTLRVYSTTAGAIIDRLVLQGSRSTVQLGKYLHLVAVKATPVNRARLQPGQIYAYDMDFGDGNLVNALNSENFLTGVIISYFSHQLPTFAMPPDDLNHLRIVHGSCRKPHGGGRDALPILDNLIEQHSSIPNSRPHQLFLTGDQIYGDDVADALLWALTDAGNTLLGWEENLPLQQLSKKPSQLQPGQRSDIARDCGGFTAMLYDQPQKAKSHLFSFGEYCAMYLFAWSGVLWPDRFPPGKLTQTTSKNARLWDKEVRDLQNFARDLPKVRRALANVSTYMICDDHDISDDWYLNLEWCNRVLSKPLGRRVVQNGLLAYAVFQAWGNAPEQFQDGQPGEKLLAATENWSLSAGTDRFALQDIAKYLGIPPLVPETNLPKLRIEEDVLVLDGNPNSLNWHYRVRSFKHEVIVLDTRTSRGYPNSQDRESNLPMLLSPTAFEKQIQSALRRTSREDGIEITLLVLPTNLVSLWAIDLIQEFNLNQGKVFQNDVGDSWTLNKVAFSRLLAELFKQRDRVVVLSGDIHYSAAVRLNYWFRAHLGDATHARKTPEQSRLLAQLTASAFKNAEFKTHLINTMLKSLAPELPQDWAGWNNPPELIEIQVIQEMLRMVPVAVPNSGLIIRQMYGTRGRWAIFWDIAVKDIQSLPEWRYRVEWIKREKAQSPGLNIRQSGYNISRPTWLKVLINFVSLLWHNQWIQEGSEVVGYSNLGLVTFKWLQDDDDAKAVIQDIYWRPPWNPNSIVYSRYFVPLRLDSPPPPPRIISP